MNMDFTLTRQRGLILDILKEMPGHPDAGMIFQEAKKRDNRISLATVYRTLDLFKKAGLVEENNLGEDHGHFEAVQGPHHYHFTCLECGKVVEISANGIPKIMQTICQQQGLATTEIHLNVRGLCLECQKKASENGNELPRHQDDQADLQRSFCGEENILLIPLGRLPDGKSGVVSQLQGGKEFMNRVASLGFTIGAFVTVIHNEARGPLIVSIMDTHLALGRNEAELIQVQPL